VLGVGSLGLATAVTQGIPSTAASKRFFPPDLLLSSFQKGLLNILSDFFDQPDKSPIAKD
jgi:hypothetical protein